VCVCRCVVLTGVPGGGPEAQGQKSDHVLVLRPPKGMWLKETGGSEDAGWLWRVLLTVYVFWVQIRDGDLECHWIFGSGQCKVPGTRK
jgi:hypothetical protein